ncbi:MAG: hypothetical protein ACK5OR_00575, partial [Betaproteobacteria bacterium]
AMLTAGKRRAGQSRLQGRPRSFEIAAGARALGLLSVASAARAAGHGGVIGPRQGACRTP